MTKNQVLCAGLIKNLKFIFLRSVNLVDGVPVGKGE